MYKITTVFFFFLSCRWRTRRSCATLHLSAVMQKDDSQILDVSRVYSCWICFYSSYWNKTVLFANFFYSATYTFAAAWCWYVIWQVGASFTWTDQVTAWGGGGVTIRKYTSLCVRDTGNDRSFLHIAARLKWAACCRLVSMCPDMNGAERTWRSEARRFSSLNSDEKHQLWTAITVFIFNTATRPRLLRCKVKK